MKKKILIPVLGLFVAVLTFSFNTNSTSSTEDISSLFVESDNVAMAEGGYSCRPATFFRCPTPYGGSIPGYMKWN